MKKRYSPEEDKLDEEISQWENDRIAKKMENMFKNTSINIKCRSQAQKEVVKLIDEKDISIIIGPPGTGKTYLACANRCHWSRRNNQNNHRRILAPVPHH